VKCDVIVGDAEEDVVADADADADVVAESVAACVKCAVIERVTVAEAVVEAVAEVDAELDAELDVELDAELEDDGEAEGDVDALATSCTRRARLGLREWDTERVCVGVRVRVGDGEREGDSERVGVRVGDGARELEFVCDFVATTEGVRAAVSVCVADGGLAIEGVAEAPTAGQSDVSAGPLLKSVPSGMLMLTLIWPTMDAASRSLMALATTTIRTATPGAPTDVSADPASAPSPLAVALSFTPFM